MRRALLAAFVAALVVPSAGSAWSWPVEGPVLRGFSLGDNPYAGGQHRGIDIGGRLGEGVRAPTSGSVSFAGTVPKNGLTVTIQTGDGLSVTLVHLGSAAVRKGATVAEGDVVGTVGPSDEPEVADPHVHLGIRVTSEPEGYLDPLRFLPPRSSEPFCSETPERMLPVWPGWMPTPVAALLNRPEMTFNRGRSEDKGSRLLLSSMSAPEPFAAQCLGLMPLPMNSAANRLGAGEPAVAAAERVPQTGTDSSHGRAIVTPRPFNSVRRLSLHESEFMAWLPEIASRKAKS